MSARLGWDDRESSWQIRDRDVANVAGRIESASDIDQMDSASSNGLGYLALAVKAGQIDRLNTWALLLGAARDAAVERLLLGGAR